MCFLPPPLSLSLYVYASAETPSQQDDIKDGLLLLVPKWNEKLPAGSAADETFYSYKYESWKYDGRRDRGKLKNRCKSAGAKFARGWQSFANWNVTYVCYTCTYPEAIDFSCISMESLQPCRGSFIFNIFRKFVYSFTKQRG